MPTMTVQAMPIVPQAVIFRTNRFSSVETRGLQEVEHLLEVFALEVYGVAQVAETQPEVVQAANVQRNQPFLRAEGARSGARRARGSAPRSS